MFEELTIVIPTQGRLDKQQTLAILPRSLINRTILAVEEHEFTAHDNEYGLDVEVVAIPGNVNGIAAIRQHFVEQCKTPYLFLVDDDMVFFKRIGETIKLDRCTDEETENMFTTLVDWLEFEDFPIVGVSARQGNNHNPDEYSDITRQMNFHGINIELFDKYQLKFNGLAVMEDFNLLLSMFTKGLKNRVMYQYCWNQLGSGKEGGCSLYRTPELQKKCAEALHDKFPNFVKLVEKKSKSGWEGLETRTDVRVQWKKAYEWGVKQNEL